MQRTLQGLLQGMKSMAATYLDCSHMLPQVHLLTAHPALQAVNPLTYV